LRGVEKQFPNDVAVIGVHSGKYIAERETSRIREASIRYEIEHPIVNDRQFRVWRSYAISAWPTLVVIDRNGYVVGTHAGEFTASMLEPVLRRLVSAPGNAASKGVPHYTSDKSAVAPSTLRYPGKVTVQQRQIAISDTGNHRILVGRLERKDRVVIERVVDHLEPKAGFGSPTAFHSPQGLAFDGDRLYVADAANHTVSIIELRTGRSRVLAGTGYQLRTQQDREQGALSSPWDLVVVGASVYVAMAGIHQIWAIDKESGRSRVHCGTGGEDIIDGPHSSALLAQPMGIAADDKRLYFADAESSAIRWADLDPRGSVGTIIGTGLFDFGDVDGVGESVRTQHEQGVTLHPKGSLLVADSYNDALKWVDPILGEATTWLRGLHEPGGLAAADDCVYIADTNAHRILVAEYGADNVAQVEISS
jgi:DNA-binding beta-propeller fold protein YncE